MKIKDTPLDKILPYARNPRVHGAAIDKVAASIKEFGFRQPIVVDAEGVIIAGHARYEAARRLGLASAPVHVAEGLTPAQVKAYRLADNRVAQEAQWDHELVGLELADLQGIGFDLGLTGFDEDELEAFGCERQGLTGDDEIPALEEDKPPITQPGDLWLLGEHRLVCGDSTRAEDVARVMGPGRAVLMSTDPPYGIALDQGWRDRAGINRLGRGQDDAIAMDEGFAWVGALALTEADVAYVWHAGLFAGVVGDAITAAGFDVRQQIIWCKSMQVLSRAAYHGKHEPCWYAVRRGKTAPWHVGRDQTTVWEAASPKQIMGGSTEDKYDHPTQKPIVLSEIPITNHTVVGEGVYDPFLGSGTTLIACEKTARRCYGIEIEPHYCDVILRRWQAYTGKEAILEPDARA